MYVHHRKSATSYILTFCSIFY